MRYLFGIRQTTCGLAVLIAALSCLRGSEVYFTYETPEGGFGVGVVKAGRDGIEQIESISGGFEMNEAFKLTRSGGFVVVSGKRLDEPGLAIFATESGTGVPGWVGLEADVSELVATGEHVFVAASRGRFYLVDPAKGEITGEVNARKDLQPAGRKGEDVIAFDGGSKFLATFQKDDDDSESIGSRVVIFDTKPLRVAHDILLPRDREDLHISGNYQEQGPNPEKALVFEESNTLALTLDLYGAVAFADWDAIQNGDIENYGVFSTSGEGLWGTAFPDRALGFEWGGTEYLLVTNASANGGLALFDVAKRERLAFYPAAAGAETPVFLPTAKKILTVVSGKVKAREESKLANSSEPTSTVLIWDLEPSEPAPVPPMKAVELDSRLVRITGVEGLPEHVLILGESKGGAEAILFNASSGTIADRKPLPGKAIRIER